MFDFGRGERLQSVVKLNSLIFGISKLLLVLKSVIIYLLHSKLFRDTQENPRLPPKQTGLQVWAPMLW